MAISAPSDEVFRLVEAIGLRTKNTREVTLRMAVNEVVAVNTVEYVNGEQIDALAAELKERQYRLARWIPVEERLPPDEAKVLVYYIPRDDDGTPSCAGCDGHGGIISTAWYERLGDGDGEHWVSDELAPPLFWMPLPEPPAT